MPAQVDVLVYDETRGVPWHKEGIPVQGLKTVDEVLAVAPELDFPVLTEAIVTASGLTIEGWQATIHGGTGSVLGVVGNRYHTFQPRKLYEFAQAIAGEGEGAFDTIFSLMGGRLVGCTLELPGDAFILPFDPSPFERRVSVTGGNDGRHALRAKRVQTRIVCANTYSQHLSEQGVEFIIRHTSGMDNKVEQARSILGLVPRADEKFIAQMTALSERPVTKADVLSFTETLLPMPTDDSDKHPGIAKARDIVASLFAASPTLDGVANTEYRLFQATAEYADHFRAYNSGKGSKGEARAVAVLDGSASDLKDRALALLS